MADYPITELLTRTIALERMQHLSREYIEAKERNDTGTMHAIARERQELRQQYMKAVK